MPRNLKISLAILSVAVLIGLISLRGLHQRIENLSQEQGSEEQVAPGFAEAGDFDFDRRSGGRKDVLGRGAGSHRGRGCATAAFGGSGQARAAGAGCA